MASLDRAEMVARSRQASWMRATPSAASGTPSHWQAWAPIASACRASGRYAPAWSQGSWRPFTSSHLCSCTWLNAIGGRFASASAVAALSATCGAALRAASPSAASALAGGFSSCRKLRGSLTSSKVCSAAAAAAFRCAMRERRTSGSVTAFAKGKLILPYPAKARGPPHSFDRSRNGVGQANHTVSPSRSTPRFPPCAGHAK